MIRSVVMIISSLFLALRRSTMSAYNVPLLHSHGQRCTSSYYHTTTPAWFGWRAKLRVRSSELKMSSQEVVGSTKTEWNVAGLKKETERNILRCHKKIQKASSRLSDATKKLEELTSSETASLEEVEQCPDVDCIQMELDNLKERLQKLNELEKLIQPLTKSDKHLPTEAQTLAVRLGVDDGPSPRPERGPGKKKGPRSSEKSRLPYRRFYSKNKIEIRVGKQATDNDELSCNPKYRDGTDWWMHASGCPGSHIVIRCGDQNLDEEVVMDAASLAARHSKCDGSTIKVSLTRCRHVTKPPGAKPGLVQLRGDIRIVPVNKKDAEIRLQRLDETMLLN